MTPKNVIISSCGRTLLLDKMLDSLKKHYNIDMGLIIEDCSQSAIESYRDFKVACTGRKAGYAYKFAAIINYCIIKEIKYLFHIEDDVIFNRRTDLNSCAEIMERNGSLCQIIFTRKKHTLVSGHGANDQLSMWLRRNNFCSIATGVFNVERMNHIIAYGSSDGNCHESKTLTPAMDALGYYSAVVDSDVAPGYDVIHVGEEVNCAKGNYDVEKVRDYFDKLES